MTRTDVFDDLQAEQEALAAVLRGLSIDDWSRPSAATGWTVADVVLHLAQTEEAVITSTSRTAGGTDWHRYGDSVGVVMAAMVRAERASGDVVFERWQAARRASVQALRRADSAQAVPWVIGMLKPRTSATTRLAEHWAYALDITGPLGLEYPDTPRLRHIAWLGHSTLPYAFRIAGLPPAEVYCELTGPDGT